MAWRWTHHQPKKMVYIESWAKPQRETVADNNSAFSMLLSLPQWRDHNGINIDFLAKLVVMDTPEVRNHPQLGNTKQSASGQSVQTTRRKNFLQYTDSHPPSLVLNYSRGIHNDQSFLAQNPHSTLLYVHWTNPQIDNTGAPFSWSSIELSLGYSRYHAT